VEANASPRWSDQGIEVFTQKVAAFTQMPKKTHDENAEKLRQQKMAKFDQTNTARDAFFARRALRFSSAVYNYFEKLAEAQRQQKIWDYSHSIVAGGLVLMS